MSRLNYLSIFGNLFNFAPPVSSSMRINKLLDEHLTKCILRASVHKEAYFYFRNSMWVKDVDTFENRITRLLKGDNSLEFKVFRITIHSDLKRTSKIMVYIRQKSDSSRSEQLTWAARRLSKKHKPVRLLLSDA